MSSVERNILVLLALIAVVSAGICGIKLQQKAAVKKLKELDRPVPGELAGDSLCVEFVCACGLSKKKI